MAYGKDGKTEAASFHYNRQGIRSVGAYQVSGIPFMTGSTGTLSDGTEARVKFPSITKSVTVINSGSAAASMWDLAISGSGLLGSRHDFSHRNNSGGD